MSFPNDRTYTVDANLIFADGAAAQTVSGASQVGGVANITDLGGNQGLKRVLIVLVRVQLQRALRYRRGGGDDRRFIPRATVDHSSGAILQIGGKQGLSHSSAQRGERTASSGARIL